MIENITWLAFLQCMFVLVNGGGFGVPVTGKSEIIAKHPLINSLNNYDNVLFYGKVRIGTPQTGGEEQIFEMSFDTGSADLVIAKKGYEKQCNSKVSHQKIKCEKRKHREFDPSKSTTDKISRGTFAIEYLDGTLFSGHTVLEYLELGEGDTRTRILVPIGIADVVANDAGLSDGVMGLGFGIGLNQEPQTLSPLECVFTQTDIPKQLGYYLQRDETKDPKGSYGGEIYFGGHNPNYVKSAFTKPAPVVPRGGVIDTWSIALKSIKVGANEIELEGQDVDGDGTPGTMAVPDTGAVDLHFPQPIFRLIWSYFKAQVPDSHFLFTHNLFLCGDLPNTLPDLTIVLQNNDQLTLRAQDYVLATEGGMVCKLALFGNDYQKVILGNTMLIKYYTVFDYGKKAVMFAEAKQPKMNAASRKTRGQARMRSFSEPQLRRYRIQLKEGTVPTFNK